MPFFSGLPQLGLLLAESLAPTPSSPLPSPPVPFRIEHFRPHEWLHLGRAAVPPTSRETFLWEGRGLDSRRERRRNRRGEGQGERRRTTAVVLCDLKFSVGQPSLEEII